MLIRNLTKHGNTVRLALAFLAVLICAAGSDAQNKPKTGYNRRTRFNTRSPLSKINTMAKQFKGCGFTIDSRDDYDVTKESFVVYVPANYDPSVPYGLLVWMHAGTDGGSPPRADLDKNRLLWVGANNAGNKRPVAARLGLALDGVENMKARYNVDEERIYVAGFSGGGRCASVMATWHASLFKGGFYICGCNGPSPNVDKAQKEGNRYVLLTGTEDMNLGGTKRVRNAYDQAGFKRVTYLEVPGMGHTVPKGGWWGKAIAALDAPFAEKAKAIFAAAEVDDKKGRLGRAINGYARAIMYGGTHDFAKQARKRKTELVQKYDSQIAEAQADAKKQKYALAVAKAEGLVKEYGNEYAVQARQLLARLSTPDIKAKIKSQQVAARKEMFESEGKEALAAAEQLLKTDIYKGFMALKSAGRKYAGTAAGKQADTRVTQIMADPEKKKRLKARYDDIQAEKLMEEARGYARKKSYILSRAKLEQIVRRFPNSPVAARAKSALEKIRNK